MKTSSKLALALSLGIFVSCSEPTNFEKITQQFCACGESEELLKDVQALDNEQLIQLSESLAECVEDIDVPKSMKNDEEFSAKLEQNMLKVCPETFKAMNFFDGLID